MQKNLVEAWLSHHGVLSAEALGNLAIHSAAFGGETPERTVNRVAHELVHDGRAIKLERALFASA